MGGAGTGVPPLELLVDPPLLLELDDELLLVDELVLPPKLDDPLEPELPPDELEPDELEPDDPLLPDDPP
jgi:hypothetical protein